MRALGLLLVVGCKFTNTAAVNGDDVPEDGKVVDAAIDAPKLDAFDANCFGGGSFYHCFSSPPANAITITSNIDTTACDNGVEEPRMIGNTSVCVIAGDSISIAATDVVEVTGSRPLALIATTTITIAGVLDASSSPTRTGPNANPTACDSPGTGTTNANGGGGGAGGSFGSRGGAGGASDGGGGTAATAATMPIGALRGGCKGGNGAPGNGTPAEGGDGGGVVYLVARGTLDVDGTINASGAGGTGGVQQRGGGGGGGSGGMIVFHAGTFSVGAEVKVLANGGGGGGGAGGNSTGDNGVSANPTNPATDPALGGQTTTAGECRGGNGAAGTTGATPGMVASNDGGGGGGGGGLGVIRVLTGSPTFPSGSVSPTPTN